MYGLGTGSRLILLPSISVAMMMMMMMGNEKSVSPSFEYISWDSLLATRTNEFVVARAAHEWVREMIEDGRSPWTRVSLVSFQRHIGLILKSITNVVQIFDWVLRTLILF